MVKQFRAWEELRRATMVRIDRFADRVAPIEARLILGALIFTTLISLFYSSEILQTYPNCVTDEFCPYKVPVYAGETPPRINWDWTWWELVAFADIGDIEMQTLTEAGLSGLLADPMMASGFLAAFLGLWLSLPLDQLFRDMIRQLEHDRLIPREFMAAAVTEHRRRRWSWGTSLIVALLMFFAILGYFEWSIDQSGDLPFLFGSTLLGALAGHRLGSAAAYGGFSRGFRERAGDVRLLPGHADNMGGWRRFGEFIAFEAVLLLLPIIWLSTWLFIELQRPELFWSCWRGGEPAWPEKLTIDCDPGYPARNAYVGWVVPQAALLLIGLTVLYRAALRPFFDATRAYRRARAAFRKRYDTLLAEPLERAFERLAAAANLDDERKAMAEIRELSKLREEVWSMPPVPLRTVVTGVFSLSALYPLIALILGVILPEGTGVGDVTRLVLGLFKAGGL